MSVLGEYIKEFVEIADENQSMVLPLVYTLFSVLVFSVRYFLIGAFLTLGYKAVLWLLA